VTLKNGEFCGRYGHWICWTLKALVEVQLCWKLFDSSFRNYYFFFEVGFGWGKLSDATNDRFVLRPLDVFALITDNVNKFALRRRQFVQHLLLKFLVTFGLNLGFEIEWLVQINTDDFRVLLLLKLSRCHYALFVDVLPSEQHILLAVDQWWARASACVAEHFVYVVQRLTIRVKEVNGHLSEL